MAKGRSFTKEFKEDAVHIVSKCWDDLMEQDRDDIARLAAEIGR